ncbi:MAG TPA: hypothetical protein VFO01_08960 [Trebonia sp.]|nr:hypothetical protein [Trebonia sp.]
MFSFVLMIAVIAFLSGAATATLLVLSIGVRKADRPRCHQGYPGSPVDSFARATPQAVTWPHIS